ncbi:MAG: hypothetical protein KAY37_16695 [Phycisphaerae bacterium]|nr:hypothetical protein [Phycisphaerae bacterium]
MRVVVEVSGGLVQNVYADGPLDVEIVDLAISDFPGPGDPTKAELEEKLRRETQGLDVVW